MSGGPLGHLRIVEFAGIGPAPFAGMLLSDLAAGVIRTDRHDAPPLNFDDALSHPHSRERGSFQQESGVAYPAREIDKLSASAAAIATAGGNRGAR